MASDKYVHVKGRYVHMNKGRRVGGAVLLIIFLLILLKN